MEESLLLKKSHHIFSILLKKLEKSMKIQAQLCLRRRLLESFSVQKVYKMKLLPLKPGGGGGEAITKYIEKVCGVGVQEAS